MLKLKLQYFGYLMWTADSLEESLILGKTEGRRKGGIRGWDGWMASPIQWRWIWVSSGRRWWRILACCSPRGRKESVMTERLNWTEYVNTVLSLEPIHKQVVPAQPTEQRCLTADWLHCRNWHSPIGWSSDRPIKAEKPHLVTLDWKCSRGYSWTCYMRISEKNRQNQVQLAFWKDKHICFM